ncbi:hypothetical protein GTQ40_16565 [Flavobacteriaceae bacterium R38]|nr:hypothetical protein [Flavobacteriaceae bacterium R38]
MKKFLFKIFLFLVLPVVILVLFIVLHFQFPFMSDYDYDGGMRLKHELLVQHKDVKKIILVGGSNLSMGINSEIIEKSFPDYQIINYGHRFQYGIKIYMKEIEPYLNKDDIVVVVPEYQLILDDYFGNQSLAKIQIEQLNYSGFQIDISPRDVLEYIRKRIKFLIRLRKGRFSKTDHHNRVSAFNKFGDCSAHWFWESKKFKLYDSPANIKTVESSYYRSYVENYSAKGVQFILIPPMYQEDNFNLNKDLVDANIKFWKNVGLDYSYSPDLMVLKTEYFYDSPYHLLYEGVQIKTNIIVSILKKELN